MRHWPVACVTAVVCDSKDLHWPICWIRYPMKQQLLKHPRFHIMHSHKPRQKHTYISIENDGTVCIRSPIDNTDLLQKILQEKEHWIAQCLESMLKQEPIVLGETLYYLGALHSVDSDIAKPLKAAISRLRRADSKKLQQCYDLFYKQACTHYMPQRIACFSNCMGLYPSAVSYRKMKRRWGSCDAKKKLTFNSAVMKLSVKHIDYIIVHELAHIKYMNHSSSFHRLVQKYCEEARATEQELRRLRP